MVMAFSGAALAFLPPETMELKLTILGLFAVFCAFMVWFTVHATGRSSRAAATAAATAAGLQAENQRLLAQIDERTGEMHARLRLPLDAIVRAPEAAVDITIDVEDFHYDPKRLTVSALLHLVNRSAAPTVLSFAVVADGVAIAAADDSWLCNWPASPDPNILPRHLQLGARGGVHGWITFMQARGVREKPAQAGALLVVDDVSGRSIEIAAVGRYKLR